MSRYFLHLYEASASVIDDEGIDAENEEAAIRRAVFSIRDVIANDVLAGRPIWLASYMSIEDENGNELRRVFFRDAICLVEADPAEVTPSAPLQSIANG